MEISVGNEANVVEMFAQQLIEAAGREPERMRRKKIADDMFQGSSELLNESYSFEEMFCALEERVEERDITRLVHDVSDNLKRIRGKKRFFW